MRLAPLIVLAMIAPAHASLWDFESSISTDRRALRTASDSAGSEVGYLTQLALEQEKIPLLKQQVDLGVARANDAADRGRSLDGRCQQAWSDADAAMSGVGTRPAPEKSIASNSTSFDDISALWRSLSDDETRIGPKSDTDARTRANDALAAAKQSLDRVETRISAMKDDLERMQSRYRQLSLLKDDIQKADNDISGSAQSMNNQAPATKARIDALGTAPESEQRTAASQKIDEFRAPLPTLAQAASTLLNSSDDFSRHWITFEKALQDFDSNSDANDSDLRDARARLDEARSALDQLRASPAPNNP